MGDEDLTDNSDVPFTVSDRIIFFGDNTLRFKSEKIRDNLALSTATAQTLIGSADSGSTSTSSLFGDNNKDCARQVLHTLSVGFKKVSGNKYSWGSAEDEEEEHVVRPPAVTPDMIEKLSAAAQDIFSGESSLLRLHGTTYVFGDIHGNYNDLIRFADIFGMPLSLKLIESNFLFLGDYVDRGVHGLETVLYLFAFKVLHPDRIFLLRGNHEAAQVNGSAAIYGSAAFREQCLEAYGSLDGDRVWQAVNRAFDMLPFCATIDNKIFCVHGGIPSAVYYDKSLDILAKLTGIRRPWTSQNDDLVNFLKDPNNAFLFELLWNDPSPNYNTARWVSNNSRGYGAYCFGKGLVDLFYKKTGFTHIIRAHESKAGGIDLQARGTLFTVFSSSNYSGDNKAAAILIHNRRINIIGLNVENQSNIPNDFYEEEEEEEDEEEEEEEEDDESSNYNNSNYDRRDEMDEDNTEGDDEDEDATL